MSGEQGDDALVQCILAMAAASPRGASPQEIAQSFAVGRVGPKDPPDAWRRWLNPVKQKALHLARAGRIEMVRDGVPVDPDAARGLVRLRLPSAAAGS